MARDIPGTKRHFGDSREMRAYIHEAFGGRILLAFSGGKDAIATWIALRGDGFDVMPYHMTLIPGLEFVESGLARYESVFGCKIVRVPHPSFFRWLRNLVYQPPERCR